MEKKLHTKEELSLDINTLYAVLEAFVVQFKSGAKEFSDAVNDFMFYDSLQKKVFGTHVLDEASGDGKRSIIEFDDFDKDIPMAWFTLVTKAIFGLFILSKYNKQISVSSNVMQNTVGDKFRINEVSVPCPRLNYSNVTVTSKVDDPGNKLVKIGGIFVNGDLAIKAPYDMEEYIRTMAAIDKNRS